MTSLWLLDFDACKDISMNQAGVDMACKAFLETDPYCPRPHSWDSFAEMLWVDFSERYLATAAKILPEAYQDLPGKFLSEVSKLSIHRSSLQRGSEPTVYTPRRGSSQLSGFRGRGGYPETYSPSGVVRGSPSPSSPRTGRGSGRRSGGGSGRGDRRGSGTYSSEEALNSRQLNGSWRR